MTAEPAAGTGISGRVTAELLERIDMGHAKGTFEIFLSYSRADEIYLRQLIVHLTMLKREGLIRVWHDRRIPAGGEVETEIHRNLESADLILLLVSPDFLASRYCYDIEMERAMERHREGTTRVIPIILRHADWSKTPFGKLKALPKDGIPIKAWSDADEAFYDVIRGIRTVLETQGRRTPSEISELS